MSATHPARGNADPPAVRDRIERWQQHLAQLQWLYGDAEERLRRNRADEASWHTLGWPKP